MNAKRFLTISTCLLFLSSTPLHAAYFYKAGKLINTKQAAWMSVQEHYAAAMNAYEKKNWYELVQHTLIITANFPDSVFVDEATYYLAVGYFHLKDYELSNQQFTKYLKRQGAPKHFEEAVEYKFHIAEKFEDGAKKHVLGFKSLPQWLPAKEEALKIYEEVISALPNHEIAAKALFSKGKLELFEKNYVEAIEGFQNLIRRFPKNPLTPKSYQMIATTYLEQAKNDYPDPDLLDLSEINLKRYMQDFPSDEEIAFVKKKFADMQELYAAQLFQIGNFYQKTKKKEAAELYFIKILSKFPDTKIAKEISKTHGNLVEKLKSNETVSSEKAQGASI